MRIGGCGGGAAAPAAPVAPEILPLLMQRLPIAEPRSFSDSSSRLPLIRPFIASLSVANLAIAVATSFCKNLACSVSIYETCSIDLRKTTDIAALGAHVTLSAALQRIAVFLAVAAVYCEAVLKILLSIKICVVRFSVVD